MKARIPRLILAGTGSGCGKTTVTCAVLKSLINLGLKTAAFKCGPDYIDPMFHSCVTGGKCRNLDSFLLDGNTIRYLLTKNSAGADVSITEGVMGFYDGIGMTVRASTYEIAQITKSPVVLVLNAEGSSLSLLAQINGFLTLFPENHIRGVLLNGCSEKTYKQLVPAIEGSFEKLVPLGFLPRMPDCALESRHLGLVTPEETENIERKLSLLAQQAEMTVALDRLLNLAEEAPDLEFSPPEIPIFGERARIAVARDAAFCFRYEDNLDLLRELGAELVPFSPLSDTSLPGDTDGLYLCGGYPELYAEDLSGNVSMRRSILKALRGGLPCIAECGGFMYLTEAIGGHPVVGFLKGKCFDSGKLTRFGYVTLRAERDCMLCKAGETIPAHEFHHWDCENNGTDFTAEKPSGKFWDCVTANENLYAGFPHFHFYSNPNFAAGFYRACLKAKEECCNV